MKQRFSRGRNSMPLRRPREIHQTEQGGGKGEKFVEASHCSGSGYVRRERGN